jgi:integrase
MGQVRDGLVKRGRTWSYVIRVPDPETGRTKPRWVGGFASEAEAKAARDEARVLARRGEYVDRSRVTVKAYLESWLDAHAVEVKPRTLASYRYIVERYVAPRIGSMAMQSVRPATTSGLYRDLLAKGGRNSNPLSTRTVDYVHAVLRKAFNDAVHTERLLSSNPVERAKRPKRAPRGPSEVWSPRELRSFLEATGEHRLHALFWLAAFTGARRGELLCLKWEDVDFDASLVHVRGSAGVINGEWVEGTTKGGRERRVSIDAETLGILKSHRERQETSRRLVGPEWIGGGRVFTTDFGHPFTPTPSPSRLAEPSGQPTPLAVRSACSCSPTAGCTTCAMSTRQHC